MPINNGSLSFNVGRDCQVVLQTSSGRVQLDNVMEFECKQETTNVKVARLDGQNMNADLPVGWTGSLQVERATSAIDNLFAQIEQAWHSGGSYQVATIYQYITNGDGSTTTYQMDACALKLDDAGTWKSDASVRQKISFTANRRRAV